MVSAAPITVVPLQKRTVQAPGDTGGGQVHGLVMTGYADGPWPNQRGDRHGLWESTRAQRTAKKVEQDDSHPVQSIGAHLIGVKVQEPPGNPGAERHA